jgi:hypothetical protein
VAAFLTSPRLRGEVGLRSNPGEGDYPRVEFVESPLNPLPAGGEREKNYGAAVVTPPSTTMVWPVMKLEASEPR